MKELQERIAREGAVLPGGILKVDGFLNHQLDPGLTLRMGEAFRSAFEAEGVRDIHKIVTVESSGIAPALATAAAFGVPLVFAKKSRPRTMPDALEARAPSPTRGGEVILHVSPHYLQPDERVLIVDDFLASGKTVQALVQLVQSAGAELQGAGFVIEKSFQGGRDALATLRVPLVSLARIRELRGDEVIFEDEPG